MDVLTNKQYIKYNTISRYSTFPIYYHIVDKKYVSGTTLYLDTNTKFNYHTVTGKETYDVLALKYYNNPTLYWVICSFNHIQDPFETPKKGTTLKIPTLSSIKYKG